MSPGDSLKAIKEQLRAIPQNGIGYGLLRYLCDDKAAVDAIRSQHEPQVCFNYLGQLDQILPDSSFAPAAESMGPQQSPHNRRTHQLSFVSSIKGRLLKFVVKVY